MASEENAFPMSLPPKQQELYCLECAAKNGWMNPSITGVLDLPPGPIDKFIKHTAPIELCSGLHSIFDDPAAAVYRNYTVLPFASGYFDRSEPHRPTLCYFAHEKVGCTYLNGVFASAASGIRLVCINNKTKIHPYPDPSVLKNVTCAACGKLTPGP